MLRSLLSELQEFLHQLIKILRLFRQQFLLDPLQFFVGVFHGMKSIFCQDEYGQIAPVYSISAGLDYPGVGPEHAYLKDIGRAEYAPVTDDEAVDAFEYIAKTEGIIAAIESSHAVAHLMKIAPTMSKDDIIICCLSGRGDKDMDYIIEKYGIR